jgi:uncharacterized protein (TIGR03437 family)
LVSLVGILRICSSVPTAPIKSILIAIIAMPAFAGYNYYYSSSSSSFQSPNWTAFGNVSTGVSGAAVTNQSRTLQASGGLISNLATGPGEVKLTLQFLTPGDSPVFSAFFGVTPGYTPGVCGLTPASWYEVRLTGYLYIYRCDPSNNLTLLATSQASFQNGSQLRAVLTDKGNIVVYIDDNFVEGVADPYPPLLNGYVGLGVQNVASPNAIVEADLGPLDTISPSIIPASSIEIAAFANHVNLQWPASTDDSDGTGIALYLISRDSQPIAFQTSLYYSDSTVAPGTFYAYTITAFDYHLNFANTTVTVRTPTVLTSAPPTISAVLNAADQAPVIAANTWVEINGTALAPDTRSWQASDFENGQMPTSLDGVSVTVNGENAFVSYISSTQVNVLMPPDLAPGPADLQVGNNGAISATFRVQANAYSTSLFLFSGGTYVAATHADGTYVGPASLYPGLSSPARAGETIVLYANGFGGTSVPVTAGLQVQSGSLPSNPAIEIGGFPSVVSFAGLISPGEYQFNIVVPAFLPAADYPVTVIYRGSSVQTGLLLTVQNSSAHARK